MQIQKKTLAIFISALAILGIGAGYFMVQNTPSSGNTVVLTTTLGEITIELDEAMPITAGNFKTLVQKGFYDGVIFHH